MPALRINSEQENPACKDYDFSFSEDPSSKTTYSSARRKGDLAVSVRKKIHALPFLPFLLRSSSRRNRNGASGCFSSSTRAAPSTSEIRTRSGALSLLLLGSCSIGKIFPAA